MRNWIAIGLSLCLGLIGVVVADVSASTRTLSATELLHVRGGGTLMHYCCKDKPSCSGTATTCATPAQGENPNDPPEMRCALRKYVTVNTSTTKACLGIQFGTTCTYSATDDICKETWTCAWNDTALQCQMNVGGGSVAVSVPTTCTPDCP